MGQEIESPHRLLLERKESSKCSRAFITSGVCSLSNLATC
jgi:hypothetical protein